MSEKVERHLIVPFCPVIKCKDRYKLIKACNYTNNSEINGSLLGFVKMHPVHEEMVPFDHAGSIGGAGDTDIVERKTSSQDSVNMGLKETLIRDVKGSGGCLGDSKGENRESDEMPLTMSKEPKTYSKKMRVGTSPTEKVSQITCNNNENNVKQLPVVRFVTKDIINELKAQKNVKLLPFLKLNKDNVKILPSNKGAQTISLNNRPLVTEKKTGKPTLKAEVKLIAKMPELKKFSDKEPSQTKPVVMKAPVNFQGKKIVIVTKNDNIMLKPLTSISNSKSVFVKQALNNNNNSSNQIGGSKPNILKKVLITGLKPTQIYNNSDSKTDKEKNSDKIVKAADNKSCGDNSKHTDKKLGEVPLKNNDEVKLGIKLEPGEEEMLIRDHPKEKLDKDGSIKEPGHPEDHPKEKLDKDGSKKELGHPEDHPKEKLDKGGSKKELGDPEDHPKEKLDKGGSKKELGDPEDHPKEKLDKGGSKKELGNPEDHPKEKLDKGGPKKELGDPESNYYGLMERNLTKDAITEIILGKRSTIPSTKGNTVVEKDKKTSLEASKCEITSSNEKDDTAQESKENESKKRQNPSSNDKDSCNNKKFCSSESNNNQQIVSHAKDNSNQTNKNNTAASADNNIGTPPTYHHADASDIEKSPPLFLHDYNLFDNDLENLDDVLKDAGMFDIVDSGSLSFDSLIIDEDTHETVKSANHMGQDKLLHGFQRPDPFLIQARKKSNYKKWQLMFFCDMQISLQKDVAGNMPIHEAVLKDDMKTLHKQCLALMARIRSVDVKNSEGSTPLHLALLNRVNPDVISILLKFNASATTTDNEGNNAFHLASYSSDVEYVRRLLECSNGHERRSDIPNFDGLTPLMISVLNNDYVIVEQLLLGGFSPNARDQKSGRTALFHAVEQNNERLVKLLLDHGGDTRIENFFGTSCHDAVYELSNVKSEIKAMIHERKKIERYRRSRGGGSPKITSARNNNRPVIHVTCPNERDYRTFVVQCKRPKIENED